MSEKSCQILATVGKHLFVTVKKEVEEEAVDTSGKYKMAVHDMGQHYPVEISAPCHKCTALKYANSNKRFEHSYGVHLRASPN